MIYILKEQFYAGSVTIGVSVSGIEADTFAEAVAKLKSVPDFAEMAKNIKESDDEISYSLEGGMGGGHGSMKNEPLDMIGTGKANP